MKRLLSFSTKQGAILASFFSATSVLVFLGRSLYLWITSILPRNVEAENMQAAILEITALLSCALLMLPMLFLNLRALQGKTSPSLTIPTIRPAHAVALSVIWISILCLGSLVALIPDYGWAGTIPLLGPGILLPIVLLVWIAAGGLLSTSQHRFWSIVGFGIAGGTGLAMVGEAILLGIGRLAGELLLGKQPLWRNLMDSLKQQLETTSTPEETINILAPYLSNPWVLIAILVFAAILVPLIEEISKVAILFWFGPRLTSIGEGFALGALCGAGFALLEGMLAIGQASLLWGISVLARMSSSLMHIMLSALLGSAIAGAFLGGGRGRLIATYLLSSSLHGLWNGITVLAIYLSLHAMTFVPQMEAGNLTTAIQVILSGLLFLLFFGFLLTLFAAGLIALPWINHHLRKKMQAEQAQPNAGQWLIPESSPKGEPWTLSSNS